MRDDSGVAAVELALVFTLLVSLLALSAPLILAFGERLRLGRAAGQAARFATSAPDRPRFGSAGRRPTSAEVAAEAIRAYQATGSSSAGITVSVSANPADALPGDQILVTLKKSVDLGPFGFILRLLNLTNRQTAVMTARAVAREE
ncbi:MAG: hypothetical protein ACRDIF_02615 [Actinomycetota bacterium]